MKIKFVFIGTLKKINNWKPNRELELPEGSTAKDAIDELQIDGGEAKEFSFVTINGVKHISMDVVLKDGDTVKMFPRSFGG